MLRSSSSDFADELDEITATFPEHPSEDLFKELNLKVQAVDEKITAFLTK
jgi:hypothetical protein